MKQKLTTNALAARRRDAQLLANEKGPHLTVLALFRWSRSLGMRKVRNTSRRFFSPCCGDVFRFRFRLGQGLVEQRLVDAEGVQPFGEGLHALLDALLDA